MHTMSNSPKDFPAMAFPNIRTAFYVQTDVEEGDKVYFDKQNGVWRKDDVTAVKAPPEGQIGDNVFEHAMNATEGIPNDRSK